MADLTTTALVKTHGGIAGSGDDTLIDGLVISVSDAMESYMGRVIEQKLAQDEIHRSSGERELVLFEWPVANLVVVEIDDTLVLDTDYELVGDRTLYRINGTAFIRWATGRIKVTYDQGYAIIPPDIELAAREQVRFAFKQTKAGGDRLGISSNTSTTGSTVDFVEGPWLPTVQAVLDLHRRKF